MSERKLPFANGSMFGYWVCRNCHKCKKYIADGEPTCEIDLALTLAYFSDGRVPDEIYKRMGADENEMAYNWKCKEIEPTEKLQVSS